MLKLHFAPGACSFVPHAALETIKAINGSAFELALVKLHKGEQSAPEYLALNPNGQVPVLIVDGKPLTQISAICDYLDRSAPQAALMPSEPWARSEALSMLAWMNNTAHATFAHVLLPHKFAEDEAAKAELKRFNTALFAKQLARIEAAIIKAQDQGQAHLFSQSPGFVDFYALVLLRWGGMAGIDPDTLPAYKAYVEKLATLPAVAAAMVTERVSLNTFKKA